LIGSSLAYFASSLLPFHVVAIVCSFIHYALFYSNQLLFFAGQKWLLRFLSAFALAIVFYVAFIRKERKKKQQAEHRAAAEEMRAENLQYQLEIEQVINYFATKVSTLTNIDDVLWDVVKSCISQLGFQDCVIYMLDAEKKVLVQKAAYGPKSIDYREIINRIEIPLRSGIVGTVGATGVAEIVNNTAKDARYIADDAVRLSEIAVPITGSNGVMGVIDSEHPDEGFYTYRHLRILNTIATMVASKAEQLQAEANIRNKEIELARLQRDVATSQLIATRAQMNPHFIFNSLNSIQQFILQGNSLEANKYLSRFSRLQREILHNCDKVFISLQKEIDILKMYLEIEQLRFDSNFSFFIDVENIPDVEEIKIPPMILQPFVENALWHGLMPKEGSKRVSVSFHLSNNGQMLHCKIIDNGIGRQAAAARKHPTSPYAEHVSKGVALVHDRLHLLQQQIGQTFTASIEDILDSNNGVAGTKVELEMFVDF
jgi:two-component system LytT family sensor kinase